jgi:hypothetical protein
VLTLNRPHVKNAIGQELLTRLRASIESLQFDDSARVLLVRSAVPGVFCAGADLKVLLIPFLLFKTRCSCCLHSIGDGLTERDDSDVATGMLFHLSVGPILHISPEMDNIGLRGTSKNISSFHRSTPVSVWYIGECMVSIVNSNEGIKEPIHGYQNCNTTQILVFGAYVKRFFVYPSYYLGQYHFEPY